MKQFTIILIILFLAGCVGFYTHEAWAQEVKYKLQPSDVLHITVHNQPDLETRTRVTADGYVTFPLIGKIRVDGITVQEFENKLKELLEKDYLVSAQVIVFIEEYHPRQVSIIGEVKRPGKYDMPYEKDLTLLEVIAMAEGFTEDADINNTKIIRMENGKKITMKIRVRDITEKGDKDKDIILKPNDVIVVPESFF
ncbi:MAG: polysaccharide biosynthesis/export family protein [Candidatus Omnitrophica bacterium]|nr:polysaccharide biosynthesis/export family protein [Candidatus Omnitrophota bacterium]